MRKSLKNSLLAAAAGILSFLCGCKCPCGSSELEKAKNMIRNNEAECVIVRDGKITDAERGRGVSPLLRLYDSKPGVLKDAVLVDKVIGRAASFVAISGGAKHVFGKVMSEDAAALLKKHGITTSTDLLVPRILNQKRDGLCPLEQSVQGIDDPAKALVAMRKRIAELKAQAMKK